MTHEALEPCPVAWMYRPTKKNDELPFVQRKRANMNLRYWQETPLYALPAPPSAPGDEAMLAAREAV